MIFCEARRLCKAIGIILLLLSAVGLRPVLAAQPQRTSGPRLPTPGVAEPAPVDSAAVTSPAGPDTVRVPLRSVRRRTGMEPKRPSVWWTTVRSGILPGWGQLANGKPVKAVLLGGIYTGLAVSAVMAEQDRKDFKKAYAAGDSTVVDRLNSAVDRRNARMWMMGATVLFSMLDAYVDAHFVGYDETWSAAIRPESREFAVTVKF